MLALSATECLSDIVPHNLINIGNISMVQLMELDEEDFNQGQQAIVASASTSMSTRNTIPDGWVVEQVPRRIGDQKDKVIHFLSFKRKLLILLTLMH